MRKHLQTRTDTHSGADSPFQRKHPVSAIRVLSERLLLAWLANERVRQRGQRE